MSQLTSMSSQAHGMSQPQTCSSSAAAGSLRDTLNTHPGCQGHTSQPRPHLTLSAARAIIRGRPPPWPQPQRSKAAQGPCHPGGNQDETPQARPPRRGLTTLAVKLQCPRAVAAAVQGCDRPREGKGRGARSHTTQQERILVCGPPPIYSDCSD